MNESASFGEWVRRRRHILDLTQADVAARVGCAVATFGRIEAGERRPSMLMAERLAHVLELETGSRDGFVASAGAFGSPASSGLRVSPDRIVGREAEMARLVDLLAESGAPARLVTVTGPAGVGKTRLAIEVAERVERAFDLPAVFADLTSATDPADVEGLIARAVNTPSAALVDAFALAAHVLRRAPALLVVDDVDPVHEASPVLLRLLQSCPELVCLVTSRTPLDVPGEHLVALAPLAAATDADPAVELFVERAAAANPRIDLGLHRAAIRAICQRLDGLPLAIELAARRTLDVDPGALLAQLEADPPPGGSVARGVVAWSYDRLSAAARRTLDLAGVFPATFDDIGVAALAEPSLSAEAVHAALDELVVYGLLGVVRRRGHPRYVAQPVVREFGQRRLEARGESDDVLGRHAHVTIARVEASPPSSDAWPQRAALDDLGDLGSDIRAALRWSFGATGDTALGRRLVAAVLPGWYVEGRVGESLRWSEAACASLGDGATRYPSVYFLAVSRWAAGDPSGAAPLIDEAIDAAIAAGDDKWVAETLSMKQLFALSRGDLRAASDLAPRCVEAAALAGDEWRGIAHLRSARLALLGGDLDECESQLAECTAAWERLGSNWGMASARGALGDLALARGLTADATSCYLEAVEAFLTIGAVAHAVARTASVANALVVAGELEAAATVCGLVESWRDEIGTALDPAGLVEHDRHRSAAVEALGPRFDVLAAQGSEAARTAAGVASLLAVPATAVSSSH